MTDPRFEPGSRYSSSDLDEVERRVGRSLPADYKTFARTYGGAFVGGLIDGSEALPILNFFRPGHEGGILDVIDGYNDLREEGVLPIARCELGNIYVLTTDNLIHYINYYGGKTVSIEVASDFSDFLSRIVISEN